MSQPKAEDSLGSLRSQHKSIKKKFMEIIEELLIAPLQPAGGGCYTGQKRKQTESAQVILVTNPDFHVPAN